MRILGVALLLALAACSQAAEAGPEQGQTAGTRAPVSAWPLIVHTPSGTYRIELNPELDAEDLPLNADLRMLDHDLARYAVKLCSLDFENPLRPDRCEIFVQADRSALLTGYIALQQGRNVQVETALATDRQRSGVGCFLTGTLVDAGFERPEDGIDIAASFSAQLPFFGWEKSPGDWVISPQASDERSAGGMWYIKRSANNLRVHQERWNYCYRDPAVYLDEVFTHAATLSRNSN